jgi:hypothetical protein
MPITDATQPKTFLERDDWIRAVLASDLPHVAVRVAVVIGFHLNVETGRCYPGIDDIKTASAVPERSLYRQIALLEKAGWISIQRVRKPGRNNEYILTRPAIPMAGDPPDETCQNYGRGDLPKQAIRPANRVAGQNKRTREDTTGSPAYSGGPRERDARAREDPGAHAVCGAPEVKQELVPDRFADLLAIWQRPWGEESEADAGLAFAIACREADLDQIIDSARRWTAAVEPRFLKPLAKWLAKGLLKKSPPQRPRRNAGKVSLSAIALAITQEEGDQ